MSKPSHAVSLAASLRTPEGAARCAQRWIDDVLAQPIGTLFEPEAAATFVHASLRGLADSDPAEARGVAQLEALCARYEHDARPLAQALGPPWPDAALRFARRPHAPAPALVRRVIDREPVRQLIRTLLVEALVEFGRKLASPVSTSRVGKGLGALGSLAGAMGAGVLGAMGGELERQVERRASEFADAALSRVLNHLVDRITDPHQAREQAELRAALAEGGLEVSMREWAAELRKADPRALAAESRRTLRDFVDDPGSREVLVRELAVGIEPFASMPLGSLLEELGLREPLVQAATPWLSARVASFDWAALFGALIEG